MMKIKFDRQQDTEHHECQSYRDGDWIVHRCPECDFELRDNWRTGELKVRNARVDVNHSGSYFPTEYQAAFEDRN